ncbi:MAG: hypothetical protein ABDH25_04075 [Dictyoglomaceae bacterium]
MELLGILISIISAIWVYKDAKRRGKVGSSAFWWAFGTFLIWIIFLPLWLIERPKLPHEISSNDLPKLCPHCGKYYDGNPFYCPYCGKKLRL